jgi:hypothetical protein
MSDAFAKQALL